MLMKSLDTIGAEDILHLLEAGVPESRKLDYKAIPSLNNLDLVKDLSAFANTDGGDLIFGIEEKKDERGQNTGIPESIVDIGNTDTLGQRINNLLLDCVQPRISPPGLRSINVLNKSILIVRVAKSWASPHMISMEKHFKCYGRNATGNYVMDVNQLRDAFAIGGDVGAKLRTFCNIRLDIIREGRASFQLSSDPKIVFHFIPVASISSSYKLDVGELYIKACGPPDIGATLDRFNADGHLHASAVSRDGTASSYTQFFRNGIMEYVRSHRGQSNLADGKSFVYLGRIEQELLTMAKSYFSVLETAQIPTPVFVVLSLLGFRNRYGMYGSLDTEDRVPLNREVMMLPELILENATPDFSKELKPIFDILGQVFGFSRSLSYGSNGDRPDVVRYQ